MEIQRADLRFRRLAAVSLVVLTAVGAVGLWALQGWLAGVARMAPSAAQPRLLAVFVWLIGSACAVLLALGVYLWRTGARVLRAARFPPPGMRVVRDTVVQRGAAAQRRARILQGVGVALVICCLALAAATWQYVRRAA